VRKGASRHDWLATGPLTSVLLGLAVAATSAACTPTVQVAPPKEPITINLNIKLDADVRLRVEEKAKQDVEQKSFF
jgi:hypothetical protein